jgi:hypothetical protein
MEGTGKHSNPDISEGPDPQINKNSNWSVRILLMSWNIVRDAPSKSSVRISAKNATLIFFIYRLYDVEIRINIASLWFEKRFVKNVHNNLISVSMPDAGFSSIRPRENGGLLFNLNG